MDGWWSVKPNILNWGAIWDDLKRPQNGSLLVQFSIGFYDITWAIGLLVGIPVDYLHKLG